MKIGIFYDCLLAKGGAERVVMQLANELDADIITSGFNKQLAEWVPLKNRVIDLGNTTSKIFKPFGILFETPLRFYLNRYKFNYDINIFCGFSAIYGSHAINKKRNIWFCFTPNRLLYELAEIKIKETSKLNAFFLKIYKLIFIKLDQKIVKNNFIRIVAQANVIKSRIRNNYKMDSSLIYSPLKVNEFSFESYGDYFLTVARLYPEKNVVLIAKAFSKMPDKKLIIVGDGPQKDILITLSKLNPNIKLLQNIKHIELTKLYSNCLGVIYMPKNEDFGLVPLEGMASGKPCIAINEGGCLETVLDNKTGFLIPPSIDQICEKVRFLNKDIAQNMKTNCIEWSKKFDLAECKKLWISLIRETI